PRPGRSPSSPASRRPRSPSGRWPWPSPTPPPTPWPAPWPWNWPRSGSTPSPPGGIDTGAWDALGEPGKAAYFADIAARNPARRIGTTADIAAAVVFALTSTFLTGQTLHIDGG